MHSAMFGRFVPMLGAFSLLACEGTNQPPRFLQAQLALELSAGELLRLNIEAHDPDGDRLSFEATSLPEGASLSAQGKQSALLSWVPSAALHNQTLRFQIQATDPEGEAATLAIEAKVQLPQYAPTLVSPNQIVFDPAQGSTLRQEVHVLDQDSREVRISLLEGPNGMQIHRLDGKSALITWRPTESQQQTHLYEALLSLSDETHTTKVRLPVLVLQGQLQCLNANPPSLWSHWQGQTLHAYGLDHESALTRTTLYASTSPEGPFEAFPMQAQEAPNHFSLPLPARFASGPLYYYLQGLDQDGLGDSRCDQRVREPSQGVWGYLGHSNCYEDAFSPNHSFESAAILPEGLSPGLSLCPSRPDVWALPETLPGHTRFLTTEPPLAFQSFDAQHHLLPQTGSQLSQDAAFIRLEASSAQSYQLHTLQSLHTCEGGTQGAGASTSNPSLVLNQPLQGNLCPLGATLIELPRLDRLVELTLTATSSTQDLFLEHLDAQGLLLARAPSHSERLSLRIGPTTGPTRLQVRSLGVNPIAYTLQNASTGLSCQEDFLGGRHTTLANAYTLFQGFYRQFVACPNVPDVFAVEVNGGETLSLLTSGGVTLEGFIGHKSTPDQVARPDARGDATLNLTAPPQPTTLYYRVSSTTEGLGYDLIQEIEDPNSACTPDRFGPAASHAPAPLTPGIHTNLRSCPSNTRHYAFTLDYADLVTVLVSRYRGNGTLEMRLLDPYGQTIGRSTSDGGDSYLEELAFEDGRYTLVLSSTGDAWFDLWMLID